MVGGRLRILDQSKLPEEQVFVNLDDYRDVVGAIKEMRGSRCTGHRGDCCLRHSSGCVRHRNSQQG